ncbi:hypothetical protein L198_05613 [Cryptococcus wingfieldii CBS 7118]|uniref:Uncharacterized protein n=1 Tax=Cryptococcus wingfieldii CBS 7118 TaxID=1295528 RepID=A0A1E3IW44_9TREE|nr:hypothetical protein L198_05613 [Cryptococcus wingfieldii CBS 7118]ODN92817.1 hypothetical protein L198_05613 [Cryptococcus wingfieldii CBS 7118]
MFATKVFAALVAASVVLAAPASQRSGSASGSPTASNSASASGTASASDSGSSSASGTASSSAASSSASLSSGDFSGQATYYTVTGTGSACEVTVTDDDYIVALNQPQYTDSDHCGDTVTITNTENGNTATARVADECPGCDSGSLDMSPGLFGALNDDDYDEGVFAITWSFSS